MKKLLIIPFVLLFTGCMSLLIPFLYQEEEYTLPEGCLGVYLYIDENINSDYYSVATAFIIKQNEKGYTIQYVQSDGVFPEAVLELSDLSFGSYSIKADAIISGEQFYIEFKRKTPEYLPEIQTAEYVIKEDQILSLGVSTGTDIPSWAYKVTGIESVEDLSRIPSEYIAFRKKFVQKHLAEEERESLEKERIKKKSIEYFINKYNGKTIHVASSGYYQYHWSEPQPFVGEILSDGKSIRFTSPNGSFIAKNTIFLLTWDESLYGSLIGTISAQFSDTDEIIYPAIVMDGEKAFVYVEQKDITQNLSSILLTYNLNSSNTAYLIDPETYDIGQVIFSVMTGSNLDTDAAFYFIGE